MKPIDQLSDAEFEHLARRAVALPDAPARLVQAALALFTARSTLARAGDMAGAATALLRQLVARLSFDSWAPQALPAGVRSVPSDARHMVFSALGRDIDLRIVPSAGHFVLTGQILGPDEAGTVEVVSDTGPAQAPRLAALDSLGEFRLDGVPGGRYVLTLHLGGDQVLLPPIEVGAPRP
jgi:hypothetical protein